MRLAASIYDVLLIRAEVRGLLRVEAAWPYARNGQYLGVSSLAATSTTAAS